MRFIPHLTKGSALLVGCLALLSLGVYGLDRHFTIPHGLKGSYYPNPNWNGEPLWVTLDPEISTDILRIHRKRFSENRFSVLWTGFLIIEKTGEYTFALTSDDGSSLYIQNRPVVDNGGIHGLETATGHIYLEAGIYSIQVKYFQAGGSYGLTLSWAQGPQPLKPLPPSVLSPQPVNYQNYRFHQRLEYLGFVLKLIWLGTLGYWIIPHHRLLKLFKSGLSKAKESYSKARGGLSSLLSYPVPSGVFRSNFFSVFDGFSHLAVGDKSGPMVPL